MSAVVRPLHRAPEAVTPTTSREPLDYCQCNRGPVIGVVTYTDDRMWFFPLGSRNDHAENSPDLRCVDCVADTAADLASGKVQARFADLAQERREALIALTRRSQISAANRPRQAPPAEGDQVT